MPKIKDTEKELKKEVDTWLPRVEEEFEKIRSNKDPDFLKNIEAYIKDAHYFLKKQDLVKAFEAVIWAWAWLEIGQQKKIIK